MAYVEDLTVPATGDAAMRRWKNRLVAAGWTVPSSSDGSTYNNSGDQITTDSGAGSFATETAWCRVRMPGNGSGGGGTYREWLVQRGAAATDWRVLYSSLGFTGGTPSASQVPTATDEAIFWGGGTAGSPTYTQMLPANGSYNWLVVAQDAAPYYNGVFTIPTGGGASATLLGMWPMRAGSYPTADTDPYAVLADYHGSVATYARLCGVSPGTPRAKISGSWRWCQFNYPMGAVPSSTGLGPSVLTAEELPAEILASLVDGGPAYFGPKGYVADARYVLSATGTTPNGTHLEQGSRYWVRCGDLWLPWGATPPAL